MFLYFACIFNKDNLFQKIHFNRNAFFQKYKEVFFIQILIIAVGLILMFIWVKGQEIGLDMFSLKKINQEGKKKKSKTRNKMAELKRIFIINQCNYEKQIITDNITQLEEKEQNEELLSKLKE